MQTKVDTLIITVGTRQVGWRCQDGAIRSFGADGNISYPHHVDELYQELDITRGSYQENCKTFPWSARDIGQRYYEYCVEWLGNDFSQVELLLDQKIIETGVQGGLKHIILWGTDQPETVSWFYRRLDTLWLAKLMEGKIKQLYPDLRVDTHLPLIDANDSNAIRQELELLVLPEVSDYVSSRSENEFILWIQNKGCTPAIASSVEICAAALGRQCQVFNACPIEPEEFFPTLPNGIRSASPSHSFKLISMGEYFWSLERLRVVSAWERGDFTEAEIWLKSHQTRYSSIYKLARILALYTHWETDKFTTQIGNWLNSNDVANSVSLEQIQLWKERLKNLKEKELYQAWESCLLIELPLIRTNYTAAFVQFAQTLERLLYIQFIEQKWIHKDFITIPSTHLHLGNDYEPGFAGLILGWCNSRKFNTSHKWYKLLDRIRKKRNDLVHKSQPATLSDIRKIWTDESLFPIKHSNDPMVIRDLMFDVLNEVSMMAPELLVRSLYQWGLNKLNSYVHG
ncbi:MAG: hypothetical protein IGS39_19030 [Calothrix sp. C42_A2020_038]|nr:hypothetical protein [Calothrix sp. C42_A2020_038]